MHHTERTRLRREPQRGSHDLALIHAIVDEAPICHLGLTDVDGHPLVVPTIHARLGDILYVHGSAASRALRRLAGGIEACCTITHLDGLVVARSGFWSSMNYRSVMIFGRARLVDDPDEAMRALDAIVDHVLPGRSSEIRRPTAKEIAATKVIALPIDEASAKVRTGDPKDDPGDLGTDVWAGTVPFRVVSDPPVPAANLAPHVPVPASVRAASRR
ncbi:unannotated protein [freshwater metagenome]|uniref:Unannotated protein n=1 Tax=freshwater metagenome TaxID=449393 RepID=A0A6J6EEK7_9ZZZZ